MEDQNDDMNVRNVDHESILAYKHVSRRQFLKVAGLAGATV
jgi:TAT (twin-arginine translocation) pathway signal sequence